MFPRTSIKSSGVWKVKNPNLAKMQTSLQNSLLFFFLSSSLFFLPLCYHICNSLFLKFFIQMDWAAASLASFPFYYLHPFWQFPWFFFVFSFWVRVKFVCFTKCTRSCGSIFPRISLVSLSACLCVGIILSSSALLPIVFWRNWVALPEAGSRTRPRRVAFIITCEPGA